MSLLLSRLALVVCVLTVAVSTVGAQPALPTGAAQKVAINADKPAEYTLAANTAGVLTLAIHGEGDLAFTVTDADGQTLPEAGIDCDMHGNAGLKWPRC